MAIEKQIPAWLSALIYAKFETSRGKIESDFKYYCADCASKTLTEKERQKEHKDHFVLQGFIASWFYGYETEAIKDLKEYKGYDFLHGVAKFKINKFWVYYPMSRVGPYEKYKNLCNVAANNVCVTCGWSLKDKPGSYCSIMCKLLHEAMDYPPKLETLVRSLKDYQVGFVWPKKKVTEKKKNKNNEDKNSQSKSQKRNIKKNKNEEKSGNTTAHVFVGGEKIEQNKVFGGKISLLKRMDMEEQKNLDEKAKKESKKRKRSPDSLKITNTNEEDKSLDDRKLQTLIYVSTNCAKLQGFRKRARKGIPYRAPFH